MKQAITVTEDFRDSFFDTAYNDWYYTIEGCGGELKEWIDGYDKLMTDAAIGEPATYYTFTGKDMNEQYGLIGSNAYPDDLTFLAFPLKGLDVAKLAMFRIKMHDYWFTDIVDNNNRHNGKR